MKYSYDFIENCFFLIQRLNAKVEAAKGFDPLFEAFFRINVEYPLIGRDTDLQTMQAELICSYISGGSEESSYALEDRIIFKINEKKIFDIQWQGPREQKLKERLSVLPQEANAFLKDIEEAFIELLPNDPADFFFS